MTNVSKREFLTGKGVSPEKNLLEKAAAIKRFETSVTGKQYKRLDSSYGLDKIIKKDEPIVAKYNRSNLIYDSKYSFYEYYNIKNFESLPFTSK